MKFITQLKPYSLVLILPVLIALIIVTATSGSIFRRREKQPDTPTTQGNIAVPSTPIQTTQQSQSSTTTQSTIVWSEESVALEVAAGDSATKLVKFTSSVALENVVIELAPELARLFGNIQSVAILTVPAGKEQAVQITMRPMTGVQPRLYQGWIHVTSKNRVFPQILKIGVTVTPPQAAVQSLLKLADQIETGDIDAALKYFSPSAINREALTSFDKTQRMQLATAFRTARLIKATDSLRVYESPNIEDDGSTREIQFSLGKDDQDNWTIISW